MPNTTRSVARRQETLPGDAPVVDQIYSATLTLLQDKQIADISVADILEAAAVSRASFYYYFKSKFAVLAGLLNRSMDDIFATVSPFLIRSPDADAESALETSIRAVAIVWHRHRAVLHETSRHWHREADLRVQWLAIVERFVVAGVAEIDRERDAGLIASEVDSRQLVTTLFWGTERILYIAGLGIDPALPDEEAAVAPLVDLWRGTLYRR